MNGNMNGKDFFELLGDLDEDIVEDAWTEESGIVTIAEERSPLSFLKIAAAAAACIALFTAGVYGFIRMKHVDYTSPGESDLSYVESSVQESESSESNDSSFISKEDAKFAELEKLENHPLGNYAPSIILIEENLNPCVQKYDDTDFAVINVERTNASEDKPVYITVCDATFSGFDFRVPVSEKIKITGPGKYVARYTKPYPIDSISYLSAETCGDSYGDGGYPSLDGLIIEGSWMP